MDGKNDLEKIVDSFSSWISVIAVWLNFPSANLQSIQIVWLGMTVGEANIKGLFPHDIEPNDLEHKKIIVPSP